MCPAHRQIGDLKGPFSLAMISIGAYKPRYLMSPIHLDLIEAIEVFKEVKAEKAVAMHWGTLKLSKDSLVEARDELIKLCKENDVEGFEIWKVGERREI